MQLLVPAMTPATVKITLYTLVSHLFRHIQFAQGYFLFPRKFVKHSLSSFRSDKFVFTGHGYHDPMVWRGYLNTCPRLPIDYMLGQPQNAASGVANNPDAFLPRSSHSTQVMSKKRWYLRKRDSAFTFFALSAVLMNINIITCTWNAGALG